VTDPAATYPAIAAAASGRDLIPAQRSAPAGALRPGRAIVLIADPAGPLTDRLPAVLADHAGCLVLQANSLPEIDNLLAAGTTGALAMVSSGFGAHTPLIISSLRRSGWQRVIALTTAADPLSAVITAFEAGASGVLRAPETAPRTVLPGDSLTRRELQVVTLLADGLTNREIATRLSLRAATVKNHLFRIGRKLGSGDRAHIVALCIRGGVIPARNRSVAD
jgi:DNA-binding NarL/FixJ family response regulator